MSHHCKSYFALFNSGLLTSALHHRDFQYILGWIYCCTVQSYPRNPRGAISVCMRLSILSSFSVLVCRVPPSLQIIRQVQIYRNPERELHPHACPAPPVRNLRSFLCFNLCFMLSVPSKLISVILHVQDTSSPAILHLVIH